MFQPVSINGRDYVDGGLVSPIPVKAARDMGADVVIAVDISAKPKYARIEGIVDVLLQTFAIMGQALGRNELAGPMSSSGRRPVASVRGISPASTRPSWKEKRQHRPRCH